MGKLRAFKTAALTEMNWDLCRMRASSAGRQEWEFSCECGAEHCYERVFLTLDEYIALREFDRAVLAEGHHLSQVERSRRLRDDAEALHAQADQQVRRAKRNRGLDP